MLEKIAIATNNPHKLREFNRLFPGIALYNPGHLNVYFHFDESGTSYYENALGKAMCLYQLVKMPVLSDDSGISVCVLDNEPGIFSARYGSDSDRTVLTDEDRCRYLLDKLNGIEDRRAFFTCCMTLVLDETRFMVVQETFEGRITEKPRGSSGFGYDPIFLVPSLGKTVAELNDHEKDLISHRGKAAAILRRMLNQTEISS